MYPVNSGMPQGSVISPTLFLNDLLCLNSKPIVSFADGSSLCHSYSYKAHPNLYEVGLSKNCMDDTLNSVLVKIEEWGRANRVVFNARKTQCCLLSHKRISDPGENVCMGGMEIATSETLDVLGTSLRSDLR